MTTSTPRLLVIADDLTGALDTGVLFARGGVPTKVVPHRRFVERLRGCGVPVLVVDTESRHLPARRAAGRVASCVRAARAGGIERFYKKTDSTLRGNIGSELGALLAASGGRELCFVPALPQAGRITRAGVQMVDGMPVHESSFARDPRAPVLGATIEAIIGSQSGIPVVTVPRGEDPARVIEGRHRPLMLVFDAGTDEDLAVVARWLADRGIARLTAGCSGFAACLPRLHDLPAGTVRPAALHAPLLVISGSLHERSIEQLRRAESRGVPSVRVDPFIAADPRWRRATTRKVAGLLASRGMAIIGSGSDRLATPRKAGTMLRHLGKLAANLVALASVRTIAIFGGDTASAVIEALGVRSIEPAGEISQGVVVSRASPTLTLVTKAGGFGPFDVIERIVGALDQEA